MDDNKVGARTNFCRFYSYTGKNKLVVTVIDFSMGNSFEYYSEEHINWMWWLDKNGKGKERKKIIIKPVLSILEKLIASFTKPGSTGEASHMGERMSIFWIRWTNETFIWRYLRCRRIPSKGTTSHSTRSSIKMFKMLRPWHQRLMMTEWNGW